MADWICVRRFDWAIGAAVAVALVMVSSIGPVAAQHSPMQTRKSADYSAFLQQFPKGGPRLISKIRGWVVSGPLALEQVTALAATANENQKAAIGAGLARAERMVAKKQPSYAAQIRQSAVKTYDEDLLIGYVAAAGNVQPEATQSSKLVDSKGLLIKFPDGGPELTSLIRILVAYRLATPEEVTALLGTANRNQKATIGAGLNHAAQTAVEKNPAYALQIQQAVVAAKDHEVVVGYAEGETSYLSEVLTAAGQPRRKARRPEVSPKAK